MIKEAIYLKKSSNKVKGTPLGSSVVRTQCFYSHGPGVPLLVGELRYYNPVSGKKRTCLPYILTLKAYRKCTKYWGKLLIILRVA